MNHELQRLANELSLDDDRQENLRVAFGLACVERVRHLLEDPRAVAALAVGRAFVEGNCDRTALEAAAAEAAVTATSHPGSNSIDGSGHAAVSATYAVSKALAGRALEAAEYAAYATVYAYSGHAISDPVAFADEYGWQVEALRSLSRSTA